MCACLKMCGQCVTHRSVPTFAAHAPRRANEIALAAKRKTLTAKDVLEAMEAMSFPDFVEPLQASLEEFKQEQQDKKDKRAAAKAAKVVASIIERLCVCVVSVHTCAS